MNNTKHALLVACLAMMPAVALAGDAAALIALDKAWGAAATADDASAMISDKLIAVDSEGVTGKSQLMEALATSEPPAGPYVASDYKVEFLDANTAIMVHSAGSGDDAHRSMHVWRKTAGKWQVAATASIAAGS